jgi:glycosyltransferase involved in cell wall biosynthesis
MLNLGIVGIINFNEWSNPDYKETGGINSVVQGLLPYLKGDRIFLYGYTNKKSELLKEKIIDSKISVFPLVFIPENSPIPRRVFALMHGWRLRKYSSVHKISCFYSHAEELCVWIKGIPYIHHLHTYVNVMEVSGRKWAGLRLFHLLWERLRAKAIHGAFRVIAVNQDVVNLCVPMIGERRVIRFPNYVDFQKFRYRETASFENSFNLQQKKIALFIGRISKVKGLELFVDIVADANKKTLKKWIGLIVGNGEYEETLREYIGKGSLSDQFVFTGPVNDQQKLSELYSMADVFLVTSISESVPLTLLESLACGTPVLSTDVGIATQVLNGRNGQVIPTRDATAFAEIMASGKLEKQQSNLIANSERYSVEYASALLNRAIEESL